eukprot:m.69237 g.69237  ORF g.69237 m.69237 type:complete len:153 (-) comp12222_c0_seq2:4859-5317(-)
MPPLTQAPAQPQQKSKKTREKLRVLFEFFDEDGSGAIDRVELMNIMRSVGHAPTEEYIDAIMAQADVNQDGKIDFEEFVNIMTSQLAANPNEFIAQEVVQSLRIFDRDLSGFVSVEDFKQVPWEQFDTQLVHAYDLLQTSLVDRPQHNTSQI